MGRGYASGERQTRFFATHSQAVWWGLAGAGWLPVFGMLFAAVIHSPTASIYANFSTATRGERSLVPAFVIGGVIAALMPAFIGASSRGATRQATAIAIAKKATPSLFFTGHRLAPRVKTFRPLVGAKECEGTRPLLSPLFYVTTDRSRVVQNFPYRERRSRPAKRVLRKTCA